MHLSVFSARVGAAGIQGELDGKKSQPQGIRAPRQRGGKTRHYFRKFSLNYITNLISHP